jgi:hypothetical protein
MAQVSTTHLPSAFELLQEAWHILREHSTMLIKLVAMIYLPINAFLYWVSLDIQSTEDTWSSLSTQIRFANLLEAFLGIVVTIGAIYLVGITKKQKLASVPTFNQLLHQI